MHNVKSHTTYNISFSPLLHLFSFVVLFISSLRFPVCSESELYYLEERNIYNITLFEGLFTTTYPCDAIKLSKNPKQTKTQNILLRIAEAKRCIFISFLNFFSDDFYYPTGYIIHITEFASKNVGFEVVSFKYT